MVRRRTKQDKDKEKKDVRKKEKPENPVDSVMEGQISERPEEKNKAIPILKKDQEATSCWQEWISLGSYFVAVVGILAVAYLYHLFSDHGERIKHLEYSMQSIQKDKHHEVQRIQLLEGSIKTNCDVFYVGKCFRYLGGSEPMKFDEAEAMCQRVGWDLANIYDNLHYGIIAEYMRGKITKGNIRITTWLGMTIDPKTSRISLSSGRNASDGELKWYPGYPLADTDHTQMGLVVMTEAKKEPQGIHSWSRESERTGALCEI